MRIAIAAALALGLVGCQWLPGTPQHTTEQAKDMVREGMLDPESAKFENVVVTTNDQGEPVVCGWVNAKNRMGAYTGFDVFLVADGKVQFVEKLGPLNASLFGACAIDSTAAMDRAQRQVGL